jgi:hypothetical protein
MSIDLQETNRYIKLISDSLKSFMRSERRAALRSVLFDVPRRSSLGWECLYRTAYPLLVELTSSISPEEIGRRMKRLCARPNFLTLSILICCYLGGRQQHILDLGSEHEDAPEQIGFVIDFWRRVCQAYRNDAGLLPAQCGDTQPILEPKTVAQLENLLSEANCSKFKRLRRLMATLELYAFILHGEQRDGLFAHGPYECGEQDLIVVREFTDLQNTYLPWATTCTRNLYPNLAFLLKLRQANAQFDLFGGVRIEPADYEDRLLACALVTATESGEIQPVPFDEIGEIERRAANAQLELYRKAAEWSPRFKIEYGIFLFANHMKTFFDIAGLEAGSWIQQAFEEAAAPMLERLLTSEEIPSIWSFMALTEGDFFYPVSSTRQARP